MKERFLLNVFLLLVYVFSPVTLRAEDNSDYQINQGDILEITVAGHDDLHRVVTVTPDGMLSFPFIGSMTVKGKKVQEVSTAIEQGLGDGYIKYPQVNISVQKVKGKKVFVYGEVNTPGAYEFTGDMTVLRAITLAGGLSKFGSESGIKILRSSPDKKDYETIRVNLKEAINSGNKNKDITIQEGDIIVVSE
ncbi:MAG: polysaccharide export protein [Candidatus Omnitrophica bacterium]|nr:polysaccharide export protein [Candidatus Omnitrophota bacterium]